MSRTGSTKSAFTELCSRVPQRMGCLCAGMLNWMEGRPGRDYTRIIVHRMPALAPLSLVGAANDEAADREATRERRVEAAAAFL